MLCKLNKRKTTRLYIWNGSAKEKGLHEHIPLRLSSLQQKYVGSRPNTYIWIWDCVIPKGRKYPFAFRTVYTGVHIRMVWYCRRSHNIYPFKPLSCTLRLCLSTIYTLLIYFRYVCARCLYCTLDVSNAIPISEYYIYVRYTKCSAAV